MSIELRILTGARSGYRERFDRRSIAIGRHARSDLRFDPKADLDVSVRHAEIVASADGGYRLRDSGSTNGTFLNGRRITAVETLNSADVIWLGAEGPQIEVRIFARDAGGQDHTVPGLLVRQPASGLRRFLAKLLGRS
jgi:pSer/pThr/pTyr-binding forkhead associated (FHA) protein